MKIICICNNKGGVGKTTTAFNLAWYFAKKGLRTLAIDTDSQQNLSDNFGVDFVGYKGLGNYLLEDRNEFEPIEINKNLHLLIGGENIEQDMLDIKNTGPLYYTLLDNFLKNFKENYDVVVIDTAPSFNTYTASAVFAGEIYVPMIPGLNEFKALDSTISFAKKFGKEISGIILTRIETNTVITQYTNDLLEELYKKYFLKTKIRKSVTLGESIMMQKSIYDYAKKSKCAEDYKTLGEEIIKREGII